MKEILTIKNLKKHFPVKNSWGSDIALVKALDGVDLKIESGKTFGIVGESGCGKTTLMRTLLRLVEPTSGSVILSEKIIGTNAVSNKLEDLSSEKLRKFRRQIGVVFQDPMGALNPRMIIKDIVSEPLVIHGKTDKIRDRVIELLENVVDFALKELNPGGNMVSKYFRSGDISEVIQKCKKHFQKVTSFKPKSSRKDSSEIYLICLEKKSPID